jgi:hypothetical protein
MDGNQATFDRFEIGPLGTPNPNVRAVEIYQKAKIIQRSQFRDIVPFLL